MREEFETAVDVILDGKSYKGKLTWELELEGRQWGIKSIIIRPRRLEIEGAELPEFLREMAFEEAFGEFGTTQWIVHPDGLSSCPAFAPDMVVIKSDTKTLILYMEIR